MVVEKEEFITAQANAWSEVVSMMLENPTNAALNGSVNGPGSSLEFTRNLREELPELLRHYRISSMLDCPCGDMTWLSDTDLSMLHSYVGMDVEKRLIDANQHNFRSFGNYGFVCCNLLTRKKFPKVDLILSRDFLAHLTTEWIEHMIGKYKESGSTYLLASNYPGSRNEFDYDPYDYTWIGYIERPHDLELPPFNLKKIDAIEEQRAPGGVISRQHELALFKLQG